MPAAELLQAGKRAPTLATTDARDLPLTDAITLGESCLALFTSCNLENFFIRQFAIGYTTLRTRDPGYLPRECFFDRPFMSIQAHPQRYMVHIQFTRPCRQRPGFPLICKQVIRSLIAVLIHAVRPPKISRFIVSVIVDSVEAHPFRPRADQLQKTLQGLQFRRNGNTSTAISRIFRAAGVEASPHHVIPDS